MPSSAQSRCSHIVQTQCSLRGACLSGGPPAVPQAPLCWGFAAAVDLGGLLCRRFPLVLGGTGGPVQRQLHGAHEGLISSPPHHAHAHTQIRVSAHACTCMQHGGVTCTHRWVPVGTRAAHPCAHTHSDMHTGAHMHNVHGCAHRWVPAGTHMLLPLTHSQMCTNTVHTCICVTCVYTHKVRTTDRVSPVVFSGKRVNDFCFKLLTTENWGQVQSGADPPPHPVTQPPTHGPSCALQTPVPGGLF